jgi:hypothetical protein
MDTKLKLSGFNLDCPKGHWPEVVVLEAAIHDGPTLFHYADEVEMRLENGDEGDAPFEIPNELRIRFTISRDKLNFLADDLADHDALAK